MGKDGVIRDVPGQGLVRHLGISEQDDGLDRALDLDVFDVFQLPYSALKAGSHAFLRRAAGADVGVMIRSGGLTRSMSRERSAGSEVALALSAMAEREGMAPEELLMRFTLSQPAVSTILRHEQHGSPSAEHCGGEPGPVIRSPGHGNRRPGSRGIRGLPPKGRLSIALRPKPASAPAAAGDHGERGAGQQQADGTGLGDHGKNKVVPADRQLGFISVKFAVHCSE